MPDAVQRDIADLVARAQQLMLWTEAPRHATAGDLAAAEAVLAAVSKRINTTILSPTRLPARRATS